MAELSLQDPARCPQCHAWMWPGFVTIGGGMHWVRASTRSGHDLAEHLPGTLAIMRPNRLPAWRCQNCKLILMRYGPDVHKEIERSELPEETLS